VVSRSARTNERTKERGGQTVRKHNVFADNQGWQKHKNETQDKCSSPFPAGFIIHVVEGFFLNSSTNRL